MNNYTEHKFHVAFTFRHNEGNGFTFVSDPLGFDAYGHYPSPTVAKRALRKKVQAELEYAMEAIQSKSRLVIGLAKNGFPTGELILVEHRGGWGYTFIGPGAPTFHGGTIGFKDYNTAVMAAREHAESLGGISWECYQ